MRITGMLCRKILVMLMAGWLLQISMGCFNHNQYEQSSLLLEENQREDLVISVQKVDDYGGIFIVCPHCDSFQR